MHYYDPVDLKMICTRSLPETYQIEKGIEKQLRLSQRLCENYVRLAVTRHRQREMEENHLCCSNSFAVGRSAGLT